MDHACPAGGSRSLTAGETALASMMFGSALDPAPVRVHRRKWFPFQPQRTVMAPCGHLHFHPRSEGYHDDFAAAHPFWQGLFIHELTHVWQTQQRGRFYLPLHRHPFCRYDYQLQKGWNFARYGIEQQAEIVRHAFLHRIGMSEPGSPDAAALEDLLPFTKT